MLLHREHNVQKSRGHQKYIRASEDETEPGSHVTCVKEEIWLNHCNSMLVQEAGSDAYLRLLL